MGAAENAGFRPSAKVQHNLGLVRKLHKSLQQLEPVYSLVKVTC